MNKEVVFGIRPEDILSTPEKKSAYLAPSILPWKYSNRSGRKSFWNSRARAMPLQRVWTPRCVPGCMTKLMSISIWIVSISSIPRPSRLFCNAASATSAAPASIVGGPHGCASPLSSQEDSTVWILVLALSRICCARPPALFWRTIAPLPRPADDGG